MIIIGFVVDLFGEFFLLGVVFGWIFSDFYMILSVLLLLRIFFVLMLI